MTNNLKDMLSDIPIPNDIDKSIESGFGRADRELRKRKFSRSLLAVVASLAIIIIISIGIIGFDKVEAAIKQALQYIPGYNVLVDTGKGKVLALQEQVLYEQDDIFVKITAASKLDKNINISVESNYNPIDTAEVFLKDEVDNIISSENWSRSGGRSRTWHGDYYFETMDESSNYILLLGDMEIPFKLEKTTEVENLLQLGNHAQDKGISIVAIKKPLKDRLMISLLNQSEEKMVKDYPFKRIISFHQKSVMEDTMYIIDKYGEKAYPVIPGSFDNTLSNFYFDIMDQEELKLVLPYVTLRYPNLKSAKIRIQTPIEGEIQNIHKIITLGKLEMEVIDARVEEENIIVKLKSNKIEDEIIHNVDVGGISGYGMKGSENWDYMELFINKNKVGRSFSIYFESPETILFGDWVIDLD